MKNMTRQERNKKKRKDVSKEVNISRSKHIIILLIKIFMVISLLILCFYLLNKCVFTKKILVKETRIVNEKIPSSFVGKKIIYLSDINYGSTIFIDDIKNIVNTINIRKPDLVLFSGNLIDENYKLSLKEQEQLSLELGKIKSTLGNYAVVGSNDLDNYFTIISQSNFKVLNNDSDIIYDDKDYILVTGINSNDDKKDIDKAFSYFNNPTSNKNIYTISLYYDDKITDEIFSKYDSDLNLTGNSNNYYFNIPILYKDIRTKEHYKLNNNDLFISRGIGTNKYKTRLFTSPTIYFYRLDN